tara:strand:+ start:107 stop:262 length:156 start_codon:yes stop_codon:yes gene_type:complete
MQYLIQLSDESREYYQAIDKRLDDIQEDIKMLIFKTEELETRVNSNRDTEE